MPRSPMPVSAAASPEPTHARRWVVVFAVALAMIQYMDRVFLSQAAPYISADLKLTARQMGYIFAAFPFAYALFEIPGGYLGDRIGPRRVLLRIVVWWSFFIAATGWMWNALSMAITQFLFGAGEAGCFPNLTKAFKRWLPSNERARAQGIMWMAARWGGAAAPLLVFACLQFMRWRAATVVFGVLGVIWAVLFYRWYRDNPREHPSVNAAEAALLPEEPVRTAGHFSVPWGKFVRSRTVWCLCGQYAVASYAFYFFLTWFPTYLLKARGLDVKQNALLAGTPLFLGGLGSLVGGWVMPHMARWLGDLRHARRALGAGGMAIAAVLLVVSTRIENPYVAITMIAVVGFFHDVTTPAAWTACMDVGGRYVGTLGGTMNMLGNFGGVVSPIAIAAIVQRSSSWTPVFYVTGAVYLIGVVCWLLLDPVTPLEEQVPERAA